MSESKFPGQEDLPSYQLSAANSGERLFELLLRETLSSGLTWMTGIPTRLSAVGQTPLSHWSPLFTAPPAPPSLAPGTDIPMFYKQARARDKFLPECL